MCYWKLWKNKHKMFILKVKLILFLQLFCAYRALLYDPLKKPKPTPEKYFISSEN